MMIGLIVLVIVIVIICVAKEPITGYFKHKENIKEIELQIEKEKNK